jgi:two-component system, sensor histidine kinase PdtaS
MPIKAKVGIGFCVAMRVMLLLCMALPAAAQPESAAVTLQHYSPAQKRLLLTSTCQFINFLTQDNLDQDSVLSIACWVTGIPFSMPYDDTIVAREQRQIRSLLQNGIQFLHRPGTHKTDLDSSHRYITEALAFSVNGKYRNWENECHFLEGDLFAQCGDTVKSKDIFLHLASRGEQIRDTVLMARAYQQLGILLGPDDSLKPVYYKRSLELYQKKSLREKEMELLWSVATCHSPRDLNLTESAIKRILQLQQLTGFKHNLYVQYMLSYICLLKANYFDALLHGKSALENLQWCRFNALSATFFMRIGAAYFGLDRKDEELYWFRKALAVRSRNTHLFWYKSLIYATESLTDMGREREALKMINTITTEYPPITIWEKMQVLSMQGRACEMLRQPKSADEYYMDMLALATKFPNADPHAELVVTFFQIGSFYASRGELKKARKFKTLTNPYHLSNVFSNCERYKFLFKIDSAEGNYRSAIQDHILYKLYADSLLSMDDRKKEDEVKMAYETAKRDKDIAVLKQLSIVQQAQLRQNKLIRNSLILGSVSLLLIAGLLFSQFKSKQRVNRVINKQNALLQHLVDEKEWLLKEVHHRVKNNLHTVICLLESQARHLESDALKAIEVSQHRIYAMSLIHQKLYQSDDIKMIDIASYIPELVRYLETSFGVTDKIRFQLDIDPIKLSVAQAIPVGLIMNESVTNSIKYAFPGEQHGLICVDMKRNGSAISLTIADNGIGMDPATPGKGSPSMGLKLITGLVDDLNGEVRFSDAEGTRIAILFSIEEPDEIKYALATEKKQI